MNLGNIAHVIPQWRIQEGSTLFGCCYYGFSKLLRKQDANSNPPRNRIILTLGISEFARKFQMIQKLQNSLRQLLRTGTRFLRPHVRLLDTNLSLGAM